MHNLAAQAHAPYRAEEVRVRYIVHRPCTRTPFCVPRFFTLLATEIPRCCGFLCVFFSSVCSVAKDPGSRPHPLPLAALSAAKHTPCRFRRSHRFCPVFKQTVILPHPRPSLFRAPSSLFLFLFLPPFSFVLFSAACLVLC